MYQSKFNVLTSVVLLIAVMVLPIEAFGSDIRKSIFSLSDEEIEEYRNVVRAMKALPPSRESRIERQIPPGQLTQ